MDQLGGKQAEPVFVVADDMRRDPPLYMAPATIGLLGWIVGRLEDWPVWLGWGLLALGVGTTVVLAWRLMRVGADEKAVRRLMAQGNTLRRQKRFEEAEAMFKRWMQLPRPPAGPKGGLRPPGKR